MSSCPDHQTNLRERSSASGSRGARPNDEGFTLVEVLISMVVLTVGLVGIAAMLAITTQMHIGARESARSTRLAQDKFDELMKLDFDADPEVAVGGSLDSDEDDYFEQPMTGVTVRWAVADGPTDDTRVVTVRVLNEQAQQYPHDRSEHDHPPMVTMPMTPRTRLANDQGFTLVEFMIAALIMSFVLGSTVMLAMQMQQAYSSQLDNAALEQEARYALDWIARDLRSAASDGYYEVPDDQKLVIDPNGGGDPDDSIQIQADISPPDGLIDDNGEDITIELDPLTRSITRYDAVADETEEMTDGIFTDLRFTFLDPTRTVTADPEDVSYVVVQVTAESRAWDNNLGERPRSTLVN